LVSSQDGGSTRKWRTWERRSIPSSGSRNNDSDGGFRMFTRLRGWFEAWKKNLFDAYDPPKPTIYVLGKKKFIKKKVLNRPKGQKGPYLK